jgi:hypothetical protein
MHEAKTMILEIESRRTRQLLSDLSCPVANAGQDIPWVRRYHSPQWWRKVTRRIDIANSLK